MAKYVAKATLWLQIESDYANGVGEAQREVENFVAEMKYGATGELISIARATDIEILSGELSETPGISVDKLWYDDGKEPHHQQLLDNGIR